VTEDKQPKDELAQAISEARKALQQFDAARERRQTERDQLLKAYKQRMSEITQSRQPYRELLLFCYLIGGLGVVGFGARAVFSHDVRQLGAVLSVLGVFVLLRRWTHRPGLHVTATHVAINGGVLIALGMAAIALPQLTLLSWIGVGLGPRDR
jgi:hypothetical protein